MTFHKILTTIFLALLGATGTAEAKKSLPAAPSKLKVAALGVNVFKLKWKDNSDNETGWEVLIALKGTKPQHFQYIPKADITSFTVFTNDLPGQNLVFQLAAYKGDPGKEKSGAVSDVAAVKALAPKTFKRPSGMKAKALDDSRIRLTWDDNSTSEGGYQIQFREKKTKKWLVLGTVETTAKYKIVASGMMPGKKYQFRVRAFSSGGTQATKFSNTALARTKNLIAPVALVATPKPEGDFDFKWKDGSSVESGFELQQAIDGGEFTPYWTFGGYNAKKTTLKTTLKGLALDQNLSFRIRAFLILGDKKTYSAFSNVAAQRSTGLNTPDGIAVTAASESSLTLKWNDRSERETGYRIEYRKVNTSPFLISGTGSNATTFTLTGLDRASDYEFRVLASNFFSGSVSPASALVRARTSDSLIGELDPLGALGVAFSYQIQLSGTSGLSTLTVTGLPDGLTFNAVTRKITGTVATAGVYPIRMTAKFNDGSTSVRTLHLRVIAPPVVDSGFPAVAVAAGDRERFAISGKFRDPDALSAARFETTSGSFDIIFFPNDARLSVDNFINYMDAGKYDTMFFHRAVKDFVVQGGGYTYDSGTGKFAEVVKNPAVPNEPGISNTRGTVAMAKKSNLPDSATSEWFVNLKDNSGSPDFLDTTNGGYTVFGRVPQSGMAVFEAINAMPRATYSFPLTPRPKLLGDVPIDAATLPATLDPATLVKVISVGPAPLLTYSVVSLEPAIATATTAGTSLVVTGVSPGTATLVVTATDLDGQTVTQNVDVTVN